MKYLIIGSSGFEGSGFEGSCFISKYDIKFLCNFPSP